jgi:hypothetical protein
MAKFKLIREATKYNPYAIGMSVAKKKAGMGSGPAHDLPKSIITKGHEIAKKIKANEEFDDVLADNLAEDETDTDHFPASIDYSKYDKATFLRNKPQPKRATPSWVGKNTDKPAYKRKAEAEGK